MRVPFSGYETDKETYNCVRVFLSVEMVHSEVYGMVTPERYFQLVVTAQAEFTIILILGRMIRCAVEGQLWSLCLHTSCPFMKTSLRILAFSLPLGVIAVAEVYFVI